MGLRSLLSVAIALLGFSLCSCSSTNLADAKVYKSGSKQIDGAKYYRVRTTAYSHVEADSLQYGKGSAAGGTLKYGMVRSAAADWSVFPVGTIFKMEGEPHIYQIDDYGSALVGTRTIDIYKPDNAGIKAWGVRNINIKVIKWGSYSQSLAILKDRTKASHVRAMVSRIQDRS